MNKIQVVSTELVWDGSMGYFIPIMTGMDGKKYKLEYRPTGSCWTCGFMPYKEKEEGIKVVSTELVWDGSMGYYVPVLTDEDGKRYKLTYDSTGSCWVCGFKVE